MSDVNHDLLDFRVQILERVNRYKTRIILPYSNAYIQVQKNLKDTLKEEQKRAKFLLDLGISAFSLVGGSLLMAVFGKATIKAVAPDLALNVIAKKSMKNAMDLMGAMDGAETAKYALGELWDTGRRLISDEAKKRLLATDAAFPSLKEFKTDPQTFQNQIDEFVLTLANAAGGVAEEIQNNPNLSDREKRNALNEMKTSWFYKSVPEKKADQKKIERDMELTWWMLHLLGLDYLVTTESRDYIFSKETARSTAEPIRVNPSSSRYPRPATRPPRTMGEASLGRPIPLAICKKDRTYGSYAITTCVSSHIEYRSLRSISGIPFATGSSIRARIEKVYGKKFFHDVVDRKTLKLAERTLTAIGENHIQQLKKQYGKL